MTTTLTALKIAAGTTITGRDGSPYRSGPEGIVYVASTETAAEIQSRTGITTSTATGANLTSAGLNGTTTSITPNVAKDHG